MTTRLTRRQLAMVGASALGGASAVAAPSGAREASRAFPAGFLWGTATAAHQVEGGNVNNDWWDFEHDPASGCVDASGDAFVAEFGPGDQYLVGSTYWGVYEGNETEQPEESKTIEVKGSSGREKIIAGSTMYHMGRGTSFRQ